MDSKVEDYMQLPYSVLLHESVDNGSKYWLAEVPELGGCKAHGATVVEAISNVNEAKRDWIVDSLETGDVIPLPVNREAFSGRLLLRMPRSLHSDLSALAVTEGVSLNQLIVTLLAKGSRSHN